MPRVLIVEDEKSIRELLDDFLSGEGYTTLLADTGRHGIEMARAEQPDLILMDLKLPLVDGLAAVHTLRDHPRTSKIPIIVMSANSSLLLHIGDQQLAEATIRKPFDLDHLLQAIRSKIGVCRPARLQVATPR